MPIPIVILILIPNASWGGRPSHYTTLLLNLILSPNVNLNLNEKLPLTLNLPPADRSSDPAPLFAREHNPDLGTESCINPGPIFEPHLHPCPPVGEKAKLTDTQHPCPHPNANSDPKRKADSNLSADTDSDLGHRHVSDLDLYFIGTNTLNPNKREH